MIWTSPTGQAYVTTPGSALLFPALMTPTGEVAQPRNRRGGNRSGDGRTAMPTRSRSRSQSHARYVNDERRRNQRRHHNRQAAMVGDCATGPPTTTTDDDPPPF